VTPTGLRACSVPGRRCRKSAWMRVPDSDHFEPFGARLELDGSPCDGVQLKSVHLRGEVQDLCDALDFVSPVGSPAEKERAGLSWFCDVHEPRALRLSGGSYEEVRRLDAPGVTPLHRQRAA